MEGAFNEEKIRVAVFGLSTEKELGLNGFPIIFFEIFEILSS